MSEENARPASRENTAMRPLRYSINVTLDGCCHRRSRGVELVGEVGRYEDAYRLCYVNGPEGIIVMLAEELG